MTRARKELISPQITPYYHCICRCVRRAFLCGLDSLTGKSYEHRKIWVVNRLSELTANFAIDVCAFAIMSNHTHLVLRINIREAQTWDEEEVMSRWERFFRLPPLVQRYRRGELASKAERAKARESIELWRERLTDISWFMRLLNEHLARKANEEDQCTGRFWEGRFKSQALLDEAAVLTCMSYVDLNPIRAGICELPEDSDFTSIKQRISELQTADVAPKGAGLPNEPKQSPSLMPLVGQKHDPHPNAIGFLLSDYLELLDWCGRSVREGKRGAIPEGTPPILERLQLDAEEFLNRVTVPRNRAEPLVLGHIDKIHALVDKLPKAFFKGGSEAMKLYRPT